MLPLGLGRLEDGERLPMSLGGPRFTSADAVGYELMNPMMANVSSSFSKKYIEPSGLAGVRG